ncbi:MAG: GNAT family N-acetyltransferase [Gammaproteobacteria bacterium]|nr:GNAT family N-acetyltransferase [Gammaproteobacteria bacterium]
MQLKTYNLQLTTYNFLPLKILSPKTESEFKKYFEFRWLMLRAPWQQPRGSERDNLENESFHVMAVDENETVIAAGRIHFISDSDAQIRYMAVSENKQKQGLGQQILHTLEQYALNKKIKYIHLHARESAIGFYQKQGYQIIEKSHLLFSTIQHYNMLKTL